MLEAFEMLNLRQMKANHERTKWAMTACSGSNGRRPRCVMHSFCTQIISGKERGLDTCWGETTCCRLAVVDRRNCCEK